MHSSDTEQSATNAPFRSTSTQFQPPFFFKSFIYSMLIAPRNYSNNHQAYHRF